MCLISSEQDRFYRNRTDDDDKKDFLSFAARVVSGDSHEAGSVSRAHAYIVSMLTARRGHARARTHCVSSLSCNAVCGVMGTGVQKKKEQILRTLKLLILQLP